MIFEASFPVFRTRLSAGDDGLHREPMLPPLRESVNDSVPYVFKLAGGATEDFSNSFLVQLGEARGFIVGILPGESDGSARVISPEWRDDNAAYHRLPTLALPASSEHGVYVAAVGCAMSSEIDTETYDQVAGLRVTNRTANVTRVIIFPIAEVE